MKLLVPLVLALAGCPHVSSDARPPPSAPDAGDALPHAHIDVEAADGRAYGLQVELALTESTRERGLMFRKELPDGTGMLFVFEADTSGPFWMRNTYVPLSIAFIDRAGTIIDIKDMQPRSEALVSSGVPARYALEVNQGWYARHGVQSGDSLGRLPATPAE